MKINLLIFLQFVHLFPISKKVFSVKALLYIGFQIGHLSFVVRFMRRLSEFIVQSDPVFLVSQNFV